MPISEVAQYLTSVLTVNEVVYPVPPSPASISLGDSAVGGHGSDEVRIFLLSFFFSSLIVVLYFFLLAFLRDGSVFGSVLVVCVQICAVFLNDDFLVLYG